MLHPAAVLAGLVLFITQCGAHKIDKAPDSGTGYENLDLQFAHPASFDVLTSPSVLVQAHFTGTQGCDPDTLSVCIVMHRVISDVENRGAAEDATACFTGASDPASGIRLTGPRRGRFETLMRIPAEGQHRLMARLACDRDDGTTRSKVFAYPRVFEYAPGKSHAATASPAGVDRSVGPNESFCDSPLPASRARGLPSPFVAPGQKPSSAAFMDAADASSLAAAAAVAAAAAAAAASCRWTEQPEWFAREHATGACPVAVEFYRQRPFNPFDHGRVCAERLVAPLRLACDVGSPPPGGAPPAADDDWIVSQLEGRTVVFVGDSLTEQQFVGTLCFLWRRLVPLTWRIVAEPTTADGTYFRVDAEAWPGDRAAFGTGTGAAPGPGAGARCDSDTSCANLSRFRRDPDRAPMRFHLLRVNRWTDRATYPSGASAERLLREFLAGKASGPLVPREGSPCVGPRCVVLANFGVYFDFVAAPWKGGCASAAARAEYAAELETLARVLEDHARGAGRAEGGGPLVLFAGSMHGHRLGPEPEPRPSRFGPERGHLRLLARTFAYVDEGGGQGDGPSGGAAEGGRRGSSPAPSPAYACGQRPVRALRWRCVCQELDLLRSAAERHGHLFEPFRTVDSIMAARGDAHVYASKLGSRDCLHYCHQPGPTDALATHLALSIFHGDAMRRLG
jgi:hypothetical protein